MYSCTYGDGLCICVYLCTYTDTVLCIFVYRLGDMMDLSADDLTGESLYNRCHAEDLQKLKKAHLDCE